MKASLMSKGQSKHRDDSSPSKHQNPPPLVVKDVVMSRSTHVCPCPPILSVRKGFIILEYYRTRRDSALACQSFLVRARTEF